MTPMETTRTPGFTAKGSARMNTTGTGLRFTTTRSQPHGFRHKLATTHSYLEAEGLYRLPLRIDMTLTLDAPGFCVMLGDLGRVDLCSTWNDNQRIVDIVEVPKTFKSMFFANQMPLHTPTAITIVYNLKSMQIRIGGEVRYTSTMERYMRSAAFPARNAEGFALRLACHKRTGVAVDGFTVTQSGSDFALAPQTDTPEPILCNIALRPGDKPRYDNIVAACGGKIRYESMIACLPEDIRAKVIEVDGFLRAYKPIKFRRTLEKNGNKVSYVASQAGVSYAIYLSRDMLTHSLQWYILANSRENWGKRVANDLVSTLEKIADEDPAFADRIFSYLHDCTGCYGPDCTARSPYTYHGATKQTCHGKILFKMTLSEFDDVLRFIQAIPG